MQVTFIQSPPWNGKNGNYSPGRVYYDPKTPNYRKTATVNKIVFHWNGVVSSQGQSLVAGVAKRFTDPTSEVSAHFDVDETQVTQFVKLTDTAYHAGVADVNSESIGIEVNAGPGNNPSDVTYETVCQLAAELCKTLNIAPSTTTFCPHRQFKNTECPGTLDLARIIGRTRGILGIDSGADTEIPVNTPNASQTVAEPPKPSFFVHTTAKVLNIRSAPELSAPIIKTTGPALVECYDTAHGQSVNGNDVWLKRREEDGWMWSGATNYNPNNLQLS